MLQSPAPNHNLFLVLNGYRTRPPQVADEPVVTGVVGSEADLYRHRGLLALSLPPPLPSETLTSADDLTEADSFVESHPEVASSLYRDHQVAELEKRVLHNAKPITLKDLLMSRPQKRPLVVLLSEPDEDIIIVDEPPSSPPTRVKPTHMVQLKLKSLSLQLISSDPNPLKVKGSSIGSTSGGESILALMMRRPRKRHQVTLKISPAALKQVADSANPLKVKGSGPLSALGLGLIFALMMKSLADSAIKKTALQKLSELLPPPMTRDQLHVIGDDFTLPHRPVPLLRRGPLPIVLDDDEDDDNDDNNFIFPPLSELESAQFIYTPQHSPNLAQVVQERIPDIRHHPALMGIFNRFINRFTASSSPNDELWVNKYAPHRMEELLVADHPRHNIKSAICNAFERLKTLTLKKPRNELLSDRRRREQKRLALLGGFIVDDFGGEELTDDDDIFLPLIIIHGPLGVGKSTAVYTAMRELKGHVHEINTGMARGRRDINTTLKEYCTTHTVHRKDGKNASFKQGLVLLEDTHILFDQDRTFWQLVTEMVNILRRPIVITCETLDNIPRQLIEFASEENAVIDVEPIVDFPLVERYLWLCGACEGYDVDALVVKTIIRNAHTTHFDLRWALMTLQLICLSSQRHPQALVKVEHGWSSPLKPMPETLDEVELWLELALASDVIDTNTLSLIPHQPQDSELVDVYVITDTHIRQPATSIELNIGDYLATTIGSDLHATVPTFGSINRIRNPTNEFIGLRQRRTPKFMEGFIVARKTRSLTPDDQTFDFDLAYANAADTTGVADNLCLWWTPNSAYITDILPIATEWVRYQQFTPSDRVPDSYRRFRRDGLELFEFSNCPDAA